MNNLPEYWHCWDPIPEQVHSEAAEFLTVLRQAESQLAQQLKWIVDRLTQIETRLEADRDQFTTLVRGLGARLELLAEDSIDRRVTAPLFKEFLRIHSALAGHSDNGDLTASAEHLERFFESHGLRLIQPRPGDQFDPHQHQPIHREETADAESHSRIAKTLMAGLGNERRLLQPARVSVFVFNKNPNEKKP